MGRRARRKKSLFVTKRQKLINKTKPAANAATLGGTRRRADGVESAPPALRVSGHGRAVPRSVLASCRLKVLGLSRVTARIYVGDRLFT